MRAHGECLGELPAAEHLDEPALGDEALRPEHAGVDLGARVEGLERLEVHHVVLDPERVPEALGLGRAPVDRRLATLEAAADVVARALALGAPTGRLAALAGDAATDPATRRLRPCRGLQLVDLHHFDLFHRDEMRHSCDHPADLRTVGELHGVVDPAQAERAQAFLDASASLRSTTAPG